MVKNLIDVMIWPLSVTRIVKKQFMNPVIKHIDLDVPPAATPSIN